MIFALGSNGSGQLGLGHTEDAHSPTVVSLDAAPPDISLIAAGGNHTLLLTGGGAIYAAGENSDGRCGAIHTAEGRRAVFSPFISTIDGSESSRARWKLCSATWEASILVSPDNHVYSCGTGAKGELGLGEGVTTADRPTRIPSFPPPCLEVVAVASCMSHTVAVLSDGSVYGWGNGRKGQLGGPFGVQWQPRLIEGIPFKAKKGVCGRDFTLIVGGPEDGNLAVLGSDQWGVRSRAPKSLPPWKDICATWGSVLVLQRSGELLAWGRNDHGQLGFPILPSLSKLAAGSEHVLALTETRKVLAWGWGEHGNCGQPTSSHGDVKEQPNELSVSAFCRMLAAGCATSWMLCD